MKRKLVRKLVKIIAAILLFYLAILLAVFSVFMIKKDQIAELLLLSFNNEINGEVKFNDITLHPFVHFPYMSLALKELEFYEHPDSSRNILEDAVAQFKNTYVVFDILDLLSDRFTITRVFFEDGYIDLIKYPSKKYNFELAIAKVNKVPVKLPQVEEKKIREKEKKPPVKKKIIKKKLLISKTLKLNLERVRFKNVHLEYNNQLNGRQSNFLFREMVATVSIMPDSIYVGINSKTEIEKIELSNNFTIRNIDVRLQNEVIFNRIDSIVKVIPGKFYIKKADFGIEGKIDLKGKGNVDLKLSGSDQKLGFLSMLLTKSGIENLETGNLFFDGKIVGSLQEEIPEISIHFGIKDLSLKIPSTADSIKNMNIDGYFNSGNHVDLSMASLKIDTLFAFLPDGFIEGVFELSNLTEPRIKYKFDLKTQLAGLERAFRIRYIDSLKGKIELHDEFDGIFYPHKGWVDNKKGNLNIRFDSISFQTTNGITIGNTSGTITDRHNRIELQGIKLNSGKSDLFVDGNISNLPNLFFDEGKNIIFRCKLRANVFDIRDFIENDEGRYIFPYQVKKLDCDFIASSTNKRLLEYTVAPSVNFSFKKLNATIDSLLMPVKITKGEISLSEDKGSMIVNFRKFEIKMPESELITSGTYVRRKSISRHFRAVLRVKKLNAGKIFSRGIIDSNLYILNTPVSGHFTFDLNLSEPKSHKISKLQILADSVIYAGIKNKVRIRFLNIFSENLQFDSLSSKKLMTSLSGKIKLEAKRLKYGNAVFKNISYLIEAKKGIYNISPQSIHWFAKNVNARYTLSPFEDPPRYSFNYSVKKLPVGHLFNTLVGDSLMTGKIDISMKLNFSGNNKDSIINSLRGDIKVQGANLKLYGIKVDDFLKKLKTDQSFDLFDIGLVVYTGPFGFMAKNGNKFSRLKVTGHEKYTIITHLVSNWKIGHDSILVDDVAFTTNINRLALKGWYNYGSNKLDFKMAWVDQKGCSILNQRLSGASNNPKMEGFGLFGPINANYTNQDNKLKSTDCKPFYKGSVSHPGK